MKRRIFWLTVLLVASVLIAFPGCKAKEKEEQPAAPAAETKGEPTIAAEQKAETYWTCPMHPEVKEKGPGKCPICGMKLVEKKVGQGEAATAGDIASPVVTGQSPAPNAQNVLVNTSVVLHVQDSGDGVEIASIAMTVNGAAVTPQITGTSSDYTVTYVPASPFAYNATVTVTVNARDLHSPPNVMSEVAYSFKTIAGDTAPPIVSGQSPAPNAQNVPVNTRCSASFQLAGCRQDACATVISARPGFRRRS